MSNLQDRSGTFKPAHRCLYVLVLVVVAIFWFTWCQTPAASRRRGLFHV